MRTVRVLVGAGPAVLVVEDLHALDPASLNLVGELATAAGLPALLVVATRPAAHAVAPELAGRTLARLCGVRGVVRQHLGPLRPAEVAEVLTQVYAGRASCAGLVHGVWQRTGGNPYALTELLAAYAGQAPEALLGPAAPVDLPSPTRSPADDLSPAGRPAPVGSSSLVGVPASVGGSPSGGPSSVGGSPSVGGLPSGGPSSAGPIDLGGLTELAELADLTGREVEVLECLVAGMSNKQVARALGISVRTVTVHVSNLLRKTGSASRTEVALWAVRRRMVAPAPVDG